MISTMGAFTIVDLRSQETTALELIKRYRRRVATEVAWELRRVPSRGPVPGSQGIGPYDSQDFLTAQAQLLA
jgi:hypothetical protein